MSNARFSITPSAAVEDTSLSDSVFRTLACLGVYGDKNGWCWPALQTIANMRGVSKPRVSADIKILIDKGYVQKRERFEQNTQITNMYRILFDTPLTPEVNPPLTSEINPPLTPEVNQNAPLNAPLNAKEDEEEQTTQPRPNVYKVYEQEIGPLTRMISEEIDDLVKTHTEQWVIAAIREASIHGARNLKYIQAILKRWAVQGYGSENKKPAQAKGTPKPAAGQPKSLDTYNAWVASMEGSAA